MGHSMAAKRPGLLHKMALVTVGCSAAEVNGSHVGWLHRGISILACKNCDGVLVQPVTVPDRLGTDIAALNGEKLKSAASIHTRTNCFEGSVVCLKTCPAERRAATDPDLSGILYCCSVSKSLQPGGLVQRYVDYC